MSPTSNPIRVVLAEPQTLFRQSLKRRLGEEPNMQIVGEAAGCLELLCLLDELAVGQLSPHLIILDFPAPRHWGEQIIHDIKTAYPDIKILIMGIEQSEEYLNFAISAGAHGYLLKQDARLELLQAIEKIRQGERFVSARLNP